MAEVQYTKSGDVNIAYQVTGEGPFDLVFVVGFVSHLELAWRMPTFAPFLDRLSGFCRLIRFDKRGTGMSDRVSDAPSLETRMDDVRAVMDAAGSERAAFYGLSEGGAMSLLFAATYPERVAALVVRSAFPRRMWAPDYPWGATEQEFQRQVARDLRLFGTREEAERAVSELGQFEGEEVTSFVDYLRYGASPGAVEALHRMNKEIDVRAVLPAVHVPTLIMRGSEDQMVAPEVAQYMTSRIPGAQFVEIPGAGHLAFGTMGDPIGDEIERFTKAVWDSGGWDDTEPERILATVLFTDIVGSTAKAAELGDRAWRDLLERHHALIRQQLMRHRGTELDVAGDGFFARFDGPARAIHCAQAITSDVRELGIEVRAGLHTGECELVDDKVGGIAVHIGARVASEAEPSEVLVSSTVKDLVAGSGLTFRDRGVAQLKGVPDEWRLYAVA